MDDPVGPVRTRLLLAAVTLSALLGGAVGAGVTAWLTADQPDRPVADAVAALAEGGEADRVAVVATAVLPSVVRIDVRGIGAGGSGAGGSGTGSGNASGVIIRADGYIVTNHHVIAGATGITVTFEDRTTVDAVLVGSDPRNDLAVIRVDRSGLPAVRLADSAAVRVGQLAVVVGAPFGLAGSVTAGIVSAVDRPVDLRGPDGEIVRLPGVVQTDAGISPGNSGGALVDSRGRLIGVNSAILSDDFGVGVGFAIPASIVASVARDLIADGAVSNPYLGLAGSTLSPGAAAQLGLPAGTVVDRVVPGSPAAQAGIVPDDVVTAVDGMAVRSMDDLVRAVRAAGVGATIVLDVVADGTTRTASITLTDADEQ
ncbi:hypothetical protein BH23ACT9_BH23ACT9_29390 [soil metagenome]